MNQFLGLSSDGGLHSVANSHAAGSASLNRGAMAGGAGEGYRGGGAAEGYRGAGAVAGGAVVGAGGNVAAAGRYGAVGGFGYASPSARYGQAYAVRGGVAAAGLYTPSWYAANRGAWVAPGLAASAWMAPTMSAMSTWFGSSAPPVSYDYGNTVVTQGDNVYVNGDNVGTTQEYYQQASDLAGAGEQAPPTDDQDWLPLGVFAMTHADKADTHMTIQMAVNKQGIIRGNFTDSAKNLTLPVQGSVDKSTQRAAWTIGDKKQDVVEAGIQDLTKDEVPILLHLGQDKTQPWLLVRLKQDDADAATSSSN